ncbi:hypothetical protein [Chryseobacterium sp. NFX27]|uniref:hypothetical protein n=1 Tax=Chryseobacterium sp. NFX27 TaxID=2819618 RepID=UPI003CEE83E5
MKKIFVGIIATSILVSCVEDEIIIKKEHEKTKTSEVHSFNKNELKKESDSIRPVFGPTEALEPTDGLDPGTSLDPGEVGPVVTTPPK